MVESGADTDMQSIVTSQSIQPPRACFNRGIFPCVQSMVILIKANAWCHVSRVHVRHPFLAGTV